MWAILALSATRVSLLPAGGNQPPLDGPGPCAYIGP